MGKKTVSKDEQPRGTLVKGRAMVMFEAGPMTDELGDDMKRAQRDGYHVHALLSVNTEGGLITVVIASKPAAVQEE